MVMSEKPQIDILVQKSDFKSACEVIGSEECVSQYKLTDRDQNSQNSDRGSNKITTCLPNTRDIAYGWTLDTMPRRKETCWSNGLVNCVIKKKS